jgi:hypothetical protein
MDRYGMTVGHSILLHLRTDIKISFDVVACFPYSISFRDGFLEADVPSRAMLNKRPLYPECAGVNMYLTYVVYSPPVGRHFLSLCSYCCAPLWSINSLSLHKTFSASIN